MLCFSFSGLKHIRGKLYEDYPDLPLALATGSSFGAADSVIAPASSRKKASSDEDAFEMSCKECGLVKQNIKGLKMHIKLLHLKSGKFQCAR